ncbi:MAG: acylphosphatase [Syntrophaceae bacterium]|nr:acylphosphatase [Syntrophaceae bacterium]
MLSTIRRRVEISGRVQGVSFRAYARSEARRLGLKGWVRNRADGSVEAVIEGPPQVVYSMITWFKKGSPFSRVDDIRIREEDPSGEFDDFEITFDKWEFWRGP